MFKAKFVFSYLQHPPNKTYTISFNDQVKGPGLTRVHQSDPEMKVYSFREPEMHSGGGGGGSVEVQFSST